MNKEQVYFSLLWWQLDKYNICTSRLQAGEDAFFIQKNIWTQNSISKEYCSNVKTLQIHQPVDVSFDAQNIFAMKK